MTLSKTPVPFSHIHILKLPQILSWRIPKQFQNNGSSLITRCLFYSCQLFQNVHFTVYLAKFFYPLFLVPYCCYASHGLRITQPNSSLQCTFMSGSMIWQYDKGYVEISMPDYIPKALANFKHPPPLPPSTCTTWMDCSSVWIENSVCNRRSLTLFYKQATTRVQAISSTFLYYARVVDPTILSALNNISNKQSKLTE